MISIGDDEVVVVGAEARLDEGRVPTSKEVSAREAAPETAEIGRQSMRESIRPGRLDYTGKRKGRRMQIKKG